MRKPRKKNYINNSDLHRVLSEYIEKIKDPLVISKPAIPKYIGEAIMMIARKYVNHVHFVAYSQHYKEEMISDGVMNCVKYLNTYNPEAATRSGYPNPFGWFTQIIKNAFKQRLKDEKRHQYFKARSSLDYHLLNNDKDFISEDNDVYENNLRFIKDYENSVVEKKKLCKKKQGLEEFIED